MLTTDDSNATTTDAQVGKKTTTIEAPECTDNFQLRTFIFEGESFSSCEQMFQAHKALPGPSRELVRNILPRAGEGSYSHGMRVWSAGQQCQALRADWETVKVSVMLAANRAKYDQHPDLAAALLGTGTALITGEGTGQWSHWNGRIQMLIREELRAKMAPAETELSTPSGPAHCSLLARLRAEFDANAA